MNIQSLFDFLLLAAEVAVEADKADHLEEGVIWLRRQLGAPVRAEDRGRASSVVARAPQGRAAGMRTSSMPR